MPNFDAGHYFLTTFAPIRAVRPDDPPGPSPVQRVREALDRLPRAHQSPATDPAVWALPVNADLADRVGAARAQGQSPFTASLRTHLCRFAVLDDAIFNGREPADALLALVGLRPLPHDPEPADRLPCAYLMFTADFDAVMTPGERLKDRLTPAEQDRVRDDYLRELWEIAGDDLRPVYRECQAFDETTVRTGEDFARYLARCQVETCMPFNDYWIDPPKAHLLPMPALGAAVGLPLLAFLLAAGAWLIGMPTWFGFPSGLAALAAAALTGAAGYAVWRFMLWNGRRPWSAPEFGDLPSVLKGLYIQQKFAIFAAEAQHMTPQDRRAAFAAFLREHQPEDVLTRTQPPGVVRAE